MLLHSHPLSGNCHKVRLLLGFLGLPYDERMLDVAAGEHKGPAFLAINPNGTIPVLDDDGIIIRDSQAILVYLARKVKAKDWLPTDAEGCARVTQWLSFAANEIHHGPARARLHAKFGLPGDPAPAMAESGRILRVLDDQLARDGWLECGRITIADLACAPYVALAPEGRIDLAPHGNVRAWLKRISAMPGFAAMPGFGA
jgi:glutathione S-transferase